MLNRLDVIRKSGIAVALFIAGCSTGQQGAPAKSWPWASWGGPGSDFNTGNKKIADSWPETGPKKIWSRQLGDGYSAIAADRDRLYTMYRQDDDEIVTALKQSDGKTVWEYKYEAKTPEEIVPDFGLGPRGTPLIYSDRLVTVGVTGKLRCLNRQDGKLLWQHDLMEEFGAKAQQFGYAASPIAYGDSIIVLVGGDRTGAVALRPADGTVLWESEPFSISYATPIVLNPGGQDQLAVMTSTGVMGLCAKTGKTEWTHSHENRYKNNCFTPIWGDDGILYISSHADAGSRALKVTRADGKTAIQELWHNPKIGFFHATAVRQGDFVYGSSGGTPPTFMVAVNIHTGEERWKERGFSKVNTMYADGKAILLDETGELALATVTPEAFTIRSRAMILEDKAWTSPTLIGSRLYLRDRKQIVAVDLS